MIDVAADSPAMAAGIQSGDVICSVNGEKMAGVQPGTYLKISRKWVKGDKVSIVFPYGGKVGDARTS